jgi:hypothetical protein
VLGSEGQEMLGCWRTLHDIDVPNLPLSCGNEMDIILGE